MDWVSGRQNNDERAEESAGQDETAHMCRLILPYTLRNIQTWSQKFNLFYQTSPGFYASAIQVFRKHCGKRRNCS